MQTNFSANAKNKIEIHLNSYEHYFEKIMNGSIAIPEFDFLIIGKEISIFNNNIIDFLAIDKHSKLIAFVKDINNELFFEKHLDITLWLDKLTLQTLKNLYESQFHRSFEIVFEDKFHTPFTEINNTDNNIILITHFLDEHTEAILQMLISNFRIPINALILEHIKNEQEEYILQSWYTPLLADTNITQQKINSWNENYSLDIPIIDRQHMMFFKIYDELLKHDPNSIDETTKLNAIEQLKNYVIGHFQTEELLIKRANYREIENHIEEHKIFINKTNEFRQSFDYKNNQIVNQMLDFIRKWFLSHISSSDTHYKTSVQEYIKQLKNN